MCFKRSNLLNSLGLRVGGAYLAGVVLSIVLFKLGLTALLTFGVDSRQEERVASYAKQLALQMQFDEGGTLVSLSPSDRDADWIYHSLQHELAYRVLDASGNAVLYSPAGPESWADAGPDTRRLVRGSFSFESKGRVFYAATEPVVRQGRTWYLQFLASARMLQLFQSQFVFPRVGKIILLFSAILLAVFGACAYVTLRRTFKPLREVSACAAAISPRTLDTRLTLEGVPTEVVPLVSNFNQALARLEHGYRAQQEFIATVAHELKTPLALIRAQVELSEASVDREALLLDVEHMTRQVQQLLLLAEASEIQNYNIEPVKVLKVVREAADYLHRMAEATDVWIELNPVDAQAIWSADSGALFTLLKNLLENAVQHTPPGTPINVEISAAAVTVRDWGMGVDVEQLPKIFERFWRGAHRRDKGAGLGLAICQEIAHAHGWVLTARRANPGLSFLLSTDLRQ